MSTISASDAGEDQNRSNSERWKGAIGLGRAVTYEAETSPRPAMRTRTETCVPGA